MRVGEKETQEIEHSILVLQRDNGDRAAMESILEYALEILRSIIHARTRARPGGRDSRSIHPAIAEEAESRTMEYLWKYSIPYMARKWDGGRKHKNAFEFLVQQVKWTFDNCLARAVKRSLIWFEYAQKAEGRVHKTVSAPLRHVPGVTIATRTTGGGMGLLKFVESFRVSSEGAATIEAKWSMEHLLHVAKSAASGTMGPPRPRACPYGERTALSGPSSLPIFLNSMAVRRPSVALKLGLHALFEGLEFRNTNSVLAPDIMLGVVEPQRKGNRRAGKRANQQNIREGFTLAASAAIAAARLRILRDARKSGENVMSKYTSPGTKKPRRVSLS